MAGMSCRHGRHVGMICVARLIGRIRCPAGPAVEQNWYPTGRLIASGLFYVAVDNSDTPSRSLAKAAAGPN